MYSSAIQQSQPSSAKAIILSPASKVAKKSPVLKSFVAGASSGAVTCVLFQPLDLVKTRLQVPSSLLHTLNIDHSAVAKGLSRKNFIYNTVSSVVRQDSFRGLWRGLTPSLYRTVPGIGMYFCTLNWMKNSMYTEPTFYQNMALGFIARSLVGTAMLPITVIKTRYESGCFHYKTVPEALINIWKMEGTKGLFSGLTATIARDAPYSGLYYMFYTYQKNSLASAYNRDLSAYENFQCGVIAGILSCIVTQPADVVKTQIQLNPNLYRGTRHCVTTILKREGVAGLTRGMLPRCLRKTLISALSWTVFEEIMRMSVKFK